MVDARGLNCPLPVVMVQREINANHPDKLEVWVDNIAAEQNVTRFAKSQAYTVAAEDIDGDYLMTLRK